MVSGIDSSTSARYKAGDQYVIFGTTPLSIHIRTKDLIHKDYPEICDAYTTDETWHADYQGKNEATLRLNLDKGTYDISIGLSDNRMVLPRNPKSMNIGIPVNPPSSLTYQKVKASFPSKKKETGPLEVSEQYIHLLIPDIEEWTKSYRIDRRNVSFVQLDAGGSYVFDSGEIPVNKTLLTGVDTSGKVTIQIKYVLTQVKDGNPGKP